MASDFTHIKPPIVGGFYLATGSVLAVTGITTSDQLIQVTALAGGGTHSIATLTNLTSVATISSAGSVTCTGAGDLKTYHCFVLWYDEDK